MRRSSILDLRFNVEACFPKTGFHFSGSCFWFAA
jgi:hypothetical protein